MPGAFEAPPKLDHDLIRTADEIQGSGERTLERLIELANSKEPPPIDVTLVGFIHRGWLETTFPVDAVVIRSTMVTNRKGTAAPVRSILPSLIPRDSRWAGYRIRPDAASAVGRTISSRRSTRRRD
jgi:hypothetical protein